MSAVITSQPQGIKPGVAPSPWDGHPLYSMPPAGWRDEQFDYHFTFSIPVSSFRNGLAMRFDYDSFFYLRGVQGRFGAAEPDPPGSEVRLYYPTGQAMQTLLVILSQLVGTTEANVQSPIWPEIVIPPGGIMTLDGQAGSGGEFEFNLILNGVKRYQAGSELCPMPGGRP